MKINKFGVIAVVIFLQTVLFAQSSSEQTSLYQQVMQPKLSQNEVFQKRLSHMASEISKKRQKASKVQTRFIYWYPLDTEFTNKLPPAGTPYQVITREDGSHTDTAHAYFWNEGNFAFLRIEPQGQHFLLDPYEFTFTQEGLERIKVYFYSSLYRGFWGNVYHASTFLLNGSEFCEEGINFDRPFSAKYGDVTFNHTPESLGDTPICEEQRVDISLPQDVTPVHASLLQGEADIYVWSSDDGHAYMHIKPTEGSLYFDRQEFYYNDNTGFFLVQNGMGARIHYRYCGGGYDGVEIFRGVTFEIIPVEGSDIVMPFDPSAGFSFYYLDYNNYDFDFIKFHKLYDHDSIEELPDDFYEKTPPPNASSVLFRPGSVYEANVSLWSDNNEAYMKITPSHSITYVANYSIIQDAMPKNRYLRRNADETWGYRGLLLSRPIVFKLGNYSNSRSCGKFDSTRSFEMLFNWKHYLTYVPTSPSQNNPSDCEDYYGNKLPPEGLEPVRFESLKTWLADADIYFWSEDNQPYLRVEPIGEGAVNINTAGIYRQLVQDGLEINMYMQEDSYSESSGHLFVIPQTVHLFEGYFGDNADNVSDTSRVMELHVNNLLYKESDPARYTPSDLNTTKPMTTLMPPKGAQSLEFDKVRAIFWNDVNQSYVHFEPKEGVDTFEIPPMDFVQDRQSIYVSLTTRENDERSSNGEDSYKGMIYGPATLRFYSTDFDPQRPYIVYNTSSDNKNYPSIRVGKQNGISPALMYYLLH